MHNTYYNYYSYIDCDRLTKTAEKLYDVNIKYAKLVAKARGAIGSTNLDDVKSFIIELSMEYKENVMRKSSSSSSPQPGAIASDPSTSISCQAMISDITKAQDATTLFATIKIYGLWDSLNYHLLETVIKHFCEENTDLMRLLNNYRDTVTTFKHDTLLCDYVDVWSGRSFLNDYPGSSFLIYKIKADFGRCTLEQVAKRESYLANMFQFQKFFLDFANARKGCVQIVWKVPNEVILHIKAQIMQNQSKITIGSNTFKVTLSDKRVLKVRLIRSLKFSYNCCCNQNFN